MQLLVALLQGLALGDQRAQPGRSRRAQVLAQRQRAALLGFNAGNVQVARHARVLADVEHHLGSMATPLRACGEECAAHALGVGVADEGHQRDEVRVALGGFEDERCPDDSSHVPVC